MIRVTKTHARNHLRDLIKAVQGGETVLILARDRPVARLGPVVERNASDVEGRLARLERAGVVRRPHRKLPESFLSDPLPKIKGDSGIVETLIENRIEGR